MNISVITWDASFRESYHTIDAFRAQNYQKEKFDFFWVDFYNNSKTELQDKFQTDDNFHLLNLNNPKDSNWHLGESVHAGVLQCKGDIIVIPDGDVIVSPDFLDLVASEFLNFKDQVVYFRRWDEPQNAHHVLKSYNSEYLEEVCVLGNPTNYGGCLAVSKENYLKIGGHELSSFFAGPGANGMELYLRFRNAGYPIKWHEQKIYHPYHANTGFSDKHLDTLVRLKAHYSWISPYSGLAQSWIMHKRELNLDFMATTRTEEYITTMPKLDELLKNAGL